MGAFLEERLPVDITYSSSFGELYNVDIIETAGGSEYRRLNHQKPRFESDVSYALRDNLVLLNGVLDLYHRCFGKYAGFRVRCLSYNTTNAHTSTPTAFDQDLTLVSTGVYQLVMRYGDVAKVALSIGRPVRNIYKPVTSTTKVSIGTIEQTGATWSVDTTTGLVTFAANITGTVTGITKAASAVVTLGAHSFTTAHNVGFSGILGMTQINGLRGNVTAYDATTITVNINSTGFSTWSAGGTQRVNTRPQSGETVKGGCEYDIPCRWDSDLDHITYENFNALGIGNMRVKEILNP